MSEPVESTTVAARHVWVTVLWNVLAVVGALALVAALYCEPDLPGYWGWRVSESLEPTLRGFVESGAEMAGFNVQDHDIVRPPPASERIFVAGHILTDGLGLIPLLVLTTVVTTVPAIRRWKLGWITGLVLVIVAVAMPLAGMLFVRPYCEGLALAVSSDGSLMALLDLAVREGVATLICGGVALSWVLGRWVYVGETPASTKPGRPAVLWAATAAAAMLACAFLLTTGGSMLPLWHLAPPGAGPAAPDAATPWRIARYAVCAVSSAAAAIWLLIALIRARPGAGHGLPCCRCWRRWRRRRAARCFCWSCSAAADVARKASPRRRRKREGRRVGERSATSQAGAGDGEGRPFGRRGPRPC